jgi:hypothetical protein
MQPPLPSALHGALVRWTYLRLLGLVALLAMASLWLQLPGLMGSQGILPAAELMQSGWRQAAERGLLHAILDLPTLLWLSSSDVTLHVLASLGATGALLVIANRLPGPGLILFWLCYLSLCTGGRSFFQYPWDMLLLETCLFSVFWAPFGLRPGITAAPLYPNLGRWLLWLLLFKLMFFSGVAKVRSGDRNWLDFTALLFHYSTQPLPNPLAHAFSRLPTVVHVGLTLFTLLVELVLPLFIFTGRARRLMVFVGLAVLQTGIALLGSHGFLNLLALVLCIPLLEDQHVRKVLPVQLLFRLDSEQEGDEELSPFAGARTRLWSRPGAGLKAALAGAAVLPLGLGVLSVYRMLDATFDGARAVEDLRPLGRRLVPFRSVNTYGLFAVMTTRRPEILLEGSTDGTSWDPIDLPYKPGRLDRAPPMTLFHMPRLDWQLWFAALAGDCDRAPWYPRFVKRLLEGAPAVTGLLASRAGSIAVASVPRYIRSTIVDYAFADRQQRRQGHWWMRAGQSRPYCPIFTLTDGRLGAIKLDEPPAPAKPAPVAAPPAPAVPVADGGTDASSAGAPKGSTDASAADGSGDASALDGSTDAPAAGDVR